MMETQAVPQQQQMLAERQRLRQQREARRQHARLERETRQTQGVVLGLLDLQSPQPTLTLLSLEETQEVVRSRRPRQLRERTTHRLVGHCFCGDTLEPLPMHYQQVRHVCSGCHRRMHDCTC